MGKNIIVALFLLMVGTAFVIFFKRKPDKPFEERNPSRAQEPRIYLEEFTVYKYERHRMKSTLSGNTGTFFDPDLLEIKGGIQGQKMDSTHKEFINAELATIRFASKGLVDLMKISRIQTCDIRNQVRIGYDDNILYTEHARYLAEQNRLVSEVPVRILGPQVDLLGSRGFEYQTKTQDLKVFGPLEGTVIGHDQKK